jgi:hypothetical protein
VETEDKTPFITVYESIGGWKAIQYWFNPDYGGFWEPWQTGHFGYATEKEAEEDAKSWAENEEIRYVQRVKKGN